MDGPRRHLRSYGRRHGHGLRKGRRDLVDNLLPDIRLALPQSGGRLDLGGVFPNPPRDIWLEVGFGAGEHLAAQAAAHPDIAMIGCEPFVNGVAGLLSRIKADGLDNIRIFDDDARILLDAVDDANIGRVFVLFADPWPKKRHHKRRFISSQTLDLLARVMKDGAQLRFASDHMGYVEWATECFSKHPCFDRQDQTGGDNYRRPADGFETRYEAKATARGDKCAHLCFIRRTRVPG